MQPYRDNTPAKAALNLQPITPLHMAILRQIESPVLLAAQILMHGTKHSAEQIAKLKSDNCADETRETIFILSTPFQKLKRLQRMDRQTLRAAAFQAVPEAGSEQALAAVQQIIGCHVGSALFEIAKKYSAN